MVQPLWETVWRLLKKLKAGLPYDLAIALISIYPKNTGVLIQRGTSTSMFIAGLLTIAKVGKEPKCPSMDEWIKKMWCVYMCVCVCVYTHTHTQTHTHTHTQNGILLDNQKE